MHTSDVPSGTNGNQPLQNFRWYAIHVLAKYEHLVSTLLRSKGYEEFLPVYRCRRQWSDRIKEVELPLFPGYLFCRFDLDDRRVPILSTTGVIRIVGAGRVPTPAGDDEIAAIQAIIHSGVPVQPWPYLKTGCRVLIQHGSLAGVEGIVLSAAKTYRLVVSVPLLQRSVAVEIDREWVRPVVPRDELVFEGRS
jgi:transcription antitermination factor NusG